MRGSIREKRPGYWELRVYAGYAGGRSRYITRGMRGGRRQAESALAELVAEVDGGRRRLEKGTMEAFLGEWLEVATSDLAPATVRAYRAEVTNHIVPHLGRLPVGQVDVQALEDLYRSLIRGGLAASSVRKTHAVLRRALGDAVRWGWRADNPAVHARPPKMQRHEVEPPPLRTALELLARAAEDDPAFGLYVRLAAASGARRAELCALRWSDLDPPRLRVARALWGRQDKDTKTHRRREMTLDVGTLAALETHRERMRARAALAEMDHSPADFIFSNALDGSEPWHPDAVSHRFARLADACGCPEVRLHDLRHWSNSVLLAASVDVPTVQRRHGHASGAMTFDVYGHALSAGDAEAARVIGSLLDPEADAGSVSAREEAPGAGPGA